MNLPTPKKRKPTKKVKSLSLPPRKKRKHVPALGENDLIVALDKLNALPLDRASKALISDILKIASNPHNESVETVIKALPPERRKAVGRGARKLTSITKGVTSRGKAGLEALTDDEWDSLVNGD